MGMLLVVSLRSVNFRSMVSAFQNCKISSHFKFKLPPGWRGARSKRLTSWWPLDLAVRAGLLHLWLSLITFMVVQFITFMGKFITFMVSGFITFVVKSYYIYG